VVTYRTGEDEAQHALARLEQSFTRQGAVTHLALQPLSRAACITLLAQLSGHAPPVIEPLADRLFAETGGNPFFLHEVVRGLLESGQVGVVQRQWSGALLRAPAEAELPLPASLRAVLAARVERLDEMSRMFLRIGAVAGRVFDYETVRQAGH